MRGVYPLGARVFRPWRNGGGETAEIVASPPGAGFGTFDWRLSTARVVSDGPFSRFEGVDRVLAVIEGGPMRLRIGAREHRLDAQSPPLGFAGDMACEARLEGPALLDLNVMVRRPLRAEVRRGPLEAGRARAPARANAPARARLALLLEARAGLGRLDGVDLDAADPALLARLAGVPALAVTIFG